MPIKHESDRPDHDLPGRPSRPSRPDHELPVDPDAHPDQELPEPEPVPPVDPSAPTPHINQI
jgi:hypothetical protein